MARLTSIVFIASILHSVAKVLYLVLIEYSASNTSE